MFVNKYTNILTYSESIVLHPGTHCVSNKFFLKCDSCFFGGLRESIQPKVDPFVLGGNSNYLPKTNVGLTGRISLVSELYKLCLKTRNPKGFGIHNIDFNSIMIYIFSYKQCYLVDILLNLLSYFRDRNMLQIFQIKNFNILQLDTIRITRFAISMPVRFHISLQLPCLESPI